MATRQHYSSKDGVPNRLDIAGGRSTLDSLHAPYRVVACLEALGLADWIPRVMDYMRIYDGFASWLEPGMPEAAMIVHLQLYQEVERMKEKSSPPEDLAALKFRLAMSFANSPVTGFGASWRLKRSCGDLPLIIHWNPVEQSWLSFLGKNLQLPDHASLHISAASQRNSHAQQLVTYLLER